MAEETIITWNATNWVTVVLMAAIAFVVFTTVVGFVRNRSGNGNG